MQWRDRRVGGVLRGGEGSHTKHRGTPDALLVERGEEGSGGERTQDREGDQHDDEDRASRTSRSDAGGMHVQWRGLIVKSVESVKVPLLIPGTWSRPA